MPRRHALTILTTFLFAICACSTSSSDDDNTTSAEYAAAATVIGEAASAGTNADASRIGRVSEMRGTCSSIAYGACSASNTRVRNFSTDGGNTDPCTRNNGSRGRNVFGQAILTFSAASCAFATADDTITRTLGNHYIQRGLNGMKVLHYTGTGTVSTATLTDEDLKDYEGTSRAGGAVLKYVDATTRKLTISGVHRRALLPNGKYGFWHTLYSDADAITVTKGGSDSDPTITLDGTLYIMQNRAKLKITKTMTGLKFDKTCPHPIDGSFTLSGLAGGTTLTVTFTGESCGNAKIAGTSEDIEANGFAG